MRLNNCKKKYIYLTSFLLLLWCNVSCSKQPKNINVNSPFLTKEKGVYHYHKTKFSGILVAYFDKENSLPKYNCSYKNGLKEGEEIIYYSSGSIASKRFYTSGIKTGVHRGWWENGNPKFEYNFNDKGEYEGTVTAWYQDGGLFRVFNYQKGKESGSQKMWKPDGTFRANYVIVNGERFGLIGLKKCDAVSRN